MSEPNSSSPFSKGGFDPKKLDRARQVLESHVQNRTTPGAVGLIVRHNSEIACFAVGKHTYDPHAPIVQPNTLYDLASVTKVVATATLCLIFAHQGKLDLDAPVQTYVPTFTGVGTHRVTIRHLLAHCGGLPAHVHLYKTHHTRTEILSAVCKLDLAYEPGTNTIYSDMGFLLIGMALETIGKNSLDHLTKQHIFDPFGMAETMYCPPPDLLPRIPPTEIKTNLRTGLVHGEVHDENAASIGGVASHAGLFATASNLGQFLRVYLSNGLLNNKRVLPTEGIRQFTTRANLAPNSTWALGWDTVSPGGSTTGCYFSEKSFGSLGFTGTSLWADPTRDLGVVLLTNRVHPTRDNAQIKQLRPEFHDAISEALL